MKGTTNGAGEKNLFDRSANITRAHVRRNKKKEDNLDMLIDIIKELRHKPW